MTRTQELQDRYAAVMMPNYGVPPVALAHGQGSQVWDVDGRQYTDLIAGIAVSALGHAHPALTEAVSRQVGLLAHASNLFLHEPQVLLAERLVDLLGTPGAKVFLSNSGTEANEAAVKVIRRAQPDSRRVIVAAEHGFHGRSSAALAMTGKASIREPFGPFGWPVRFVPFGDAAALRLAVGDDTAAVVLEPGQGEAGVIPVPPGYLQAAREICDRSGALLVLDEIQSGLGRTGHWFAHQQHDVTPDVVTLAKGLGGGLPIGACIGLGRCATALQAGDHGSTFGGNPVACAAALAVLDTIENDGLLDRAAATGQQLRDGISAVDAADVQTACREAGFLVNAVQPDAIRLAPPLILTPDEAAAFCAALPAILESAAAVAAVPQGA
jgi:acetylornithine aminotransferase